MKKILIIVLIIAATQSIVAQETYRSPKIKLSGRITDTITGTPLPGATVYLADDKRGVSADTNGYYQFNNIPPGHHILEISHTGYSTTVAHIEFSTDTRKDFALSSVVIENQGVIVTGITGATSIRQSPVPVSMVRRAELMQTTASNIIDAITKVPGVSQLSTGPGISKPLIRGLGYNRVVVVNDGVRQEGQQWGDEHGVEIDEQSVNRVEIVKGPSSLIYGSDALAGVIHFITNTPVAEGPVKGNLLTNYQTNNGLFAGNFNLAGNKNGLNWNAYVSGKTAGDYRNKYDGKVLNSRFNEMNFGGYIGLNKNWGYSHIIFSKFAQNIGLIEGERDPPTGHFILFGGTPTERVATEEDFDRRKPFVPYQEVRHTRVVLDNNFVVRKSRLKINLAYQQNLRKEFGDPQNPLDEQLFFDLSTFNYNVQWQLPEWKEWHTTIGTSGMAQQNKNRGEEFLIPAYNLFDVGGFVFIQRLYKKTSWSGGFRFDNRNIDSKGLMIGTEAKFTAFSRSFSNLSGSIGFSFEPSSNLVLKANVARGFRTPTLPELASNGSHEGTNRYEYGRNNLHSETSLQTDAGIDLNYEHFSIGMSVFYNRINDFIFYTKLESINGGDSIVNTGNELIPAFQFMQQDAGLLGAEFSLDFHPHPLDWLHIENNFSWVRGRFDNAIDGSKFLPLIPAARWNTELRADIRKPGRSLQNFYAKVEANFTFAQNNPFTGFDTETTSPGYTLLNAGIGSNILNSKKKTFCAVHFGILNLLNTSYQNHLSRLKYTALNEITGRQGVFNAGRNFSVKLNFPFSFD